MEIQKREGVRVDYRRVMFETDNNSTRIFFNKKNFIFTNY